VNPDDVFLHEMERSITRDDGLDPLDGTNGAAGAGDLALFAEDLCTAFPETPLPERMAEDHIAAMIGAIQLLAEKGESALEPTSNAHGPDRRVSGLPKLRRRTMKQKMILRLTVTAGMLVSLAGLAHAGVLPDPIQGTVEDVLGINDEGDQANVDDGAVDDVDDSAVGDTDDGAVDDADDGAVDDSDEGAVGDTDDGAVGDTDDGAQEDADDASEGDTDDGAQEDVDDGSQEDADDGSEANGDEGSNE
jgi:hypothetical protein